MEILAVVDDISKVAEQFRPLYEKPEGEEKFKLSSKPEVKSAIEALMGMQTALKAARQDAEAAKKNRVDLTPLKEFGENPEEVATKIKEQIKTLQDQVAGEGKKKLDLDELRRSMAEAHGKDKERYENQIKKLTLQLEDILFKKEAIQAIAAEKGDPELLMPLLERQKSTETLEDGSIRIAILDENKAPRYSVTNPGKLMDIVERVKEMKGHASYGKLFASEAPRGGGTPPGSASGRSGKSEGGTELTANQKISAGLKKGQFQSSKGV